MLTRKIGTLVRTFGECFRFMSSKLSADDPDIYHGAPVGVQLMGRKFDEERTLGIAIEVANILTSK